jgi:hypothetical protein
MNLGGKCFGFLNQRSNFSLQTKQTGSRQIHQLFKEISILCGLCGVSL